MSNLNITLPESLKGFIAEQTVRGGFKSESEYLQALILDAQKREAKLELEAKLLEGLESPLSPMSSADWTELKQQVLERSPELKGQ
jgi:antitoxin ParD1/3/4